MKKYILFFTTLIAFLSFTHTAWAKQITSVVTNDSVVITVNCKLCDTAVPGFIKVINPIGGATQKQTFTNLKKDKPLSFTFKNLELGKTYNIEVWSDNSEAINDDGVHAVIRASFKTPANATSPPTPGNTTPMKVDVKKSGTTATISVTCYQQCNGLKGGATVTGDGYKKTSPEKSLVTGVAAVYTFEGLTVGKTYSVLGEPALPSGTIYTWKSTFTMDATNTGPQTVNADIPIEVPAQYGSGFTENSYKLLAPIGINGNDLTEVQTSGGTCPTNKDIPNGVGCYLNTIFLLAIGICGVLAVIMIVVSSIQYMGDESVFGKTEAKSKITSAILGLLLALGSYALLRTIDPALTGQNGVNVSEINADIEEDEIPRFSDEETAHVPIPKGTIALCKEGVDWFQTETVRFKACKSVGPKLKALIAAAKKDGLSISGGGFRTAQEQIDRRVANHCPDIYKSPAKACKPPTAPPGRSMHESGLAFDFRCNGKSIPQHSKTDACYVWLTKHASEFNLINLKSKYPYDESWHWSTNGR